ncbi:MAG: hypothetical protein WDA27_11235 [Actinomycetota bacterium]
MGREQHQETPAGIPTRIADLAEDLDRTLESVRNHSRAGRADLAVKILDVQRTNLARFIDAVARDAAVSPRPSCRAIVTAHADA